MVHVIPPFARRPRFYELEVDPNMIEAIRTELRQVVREEVQTALRLGRSDSDLLTRSQAATLLDISLPTLREWTYEGKLTAYRMGTRVYYKRSELLASLEKIRTSPS